MKKNFLLITSLFIPRIGGVPVYYGNLLLHLSQYTGIVFTRNEVNSQVSDKEMLKKNIRIYRSANFPQNTNIECSFRWFFLLCKLMRQIFCLPEINDIGFILIGQATISHMVIGFMLKIFLNKPYFLFLHGEEIPIVPLKSNFLSHFFYKQADLYFCNSDFTLQRLNNYLAGVSDRAFVLVPGVESKFINSAHFADVETLRRKMRLESKRVIYTIARLDQRKGHSVVLDALPLIIKEFSNLRYLIGGVGDQLSILEMKVKENGLEDYVVFVGSVPSGEIVNYHRLGEIFVMPNRTLDNGDTEGFGIVFLEANAVGNPVIGGNAGGTAAAVVDGVTGFLVDPVDVQQIAEKVCLLLKNSELSRSMGAAGRKRVEEGFLWPDVSMRFETILNDYWGR